MKLLRLSLQQVVGDARQGSGYRKFWSRRDEVGRGESLRARGVLQSSARVSAQSVPVTSGRHAPQRRRLGSAWARVRNYRTRRPELVWATESLQPKFANHCRFSWLLAIAILIQSHYENARHLFEVDSMGSR